MGCVLLYNQHKKYGKEGFIMPFEAAKCPSCNANIEVPAEKETVFCAYCGSAIKSKAAIAYGNSVRIEGEVKVEGIATVEKLVQNAQTYEKLNENDKAFKVYKQITEEYTNDYRGWLGVFLVGMKTCFFLESATERPCDYATSEKCYKNAYNLADSKMELEKIYEREWLNLFDRISNGIYDISDMERCRIFFYTLIHSNYKTLKYPHIVSRIFDDLENNNIIADQKYIKNFLLLTYKNAKHFNGNYYQDLKENHVIDFECDFINYNYYKYEYKLLFQCNKMFVWGVHVPNEETVWLMVDINNKPVNLDEADKIISKTEAKREAKGLCIKCGGGYSILGKCKKCGNKRD